MVPPSASQQVRAIINAVQKQNGQFNFLASVINRAGYPIWDKAKLVSMGNSRINGRDVTGAPGGEIVYVPFARDSAYQVGAVLKVQFSRTDTIYRMLYANRYAAFGFDTATNAGWTARDVFSLFAGFDHQVFGHTKFQITDSRLFNTKEGAEVVATLKPRQRPPGNGREAAMYMEECMDWEICILCPLARTTDLCYNCFQMELCTRYYDSDGGSGGDSGGGWTGSGDGTGGSGDGGTGGGGGSGWYGGGGSGDPCSGVVQRSALRVIDGCDGWEPVVYDINWFNSLQPYVIDVSGLAQFPCIQELVNSIISLNNSTIKIIKDIFNESTKFDIKFVLKPNLGVAAKTVNTSLAYIQLPGQTQKLARLKFDLQLDPNYFTTSTKLYLAESIIHEMIHTYFSYRQTDAYGDPVKTQLLEQQLSFLKPYDPNGSSAVSSQHEQMAASYTDQIAEALRQYRLLAESDLNIWRSQYPGITVNDYYKALAWGGLTKDPSGNFVTLGWKSFEQNHPDQALMYRKINVAEQNGTEDASSKQKCQ